jgi:Flp pilus assembly protein TadD
LLQKRQVDAALAHLNRAVELEPKDLRARRNLAIALTQKGDLAAAQAQYERILEQEPDDIAAHANLSRLHLGAGRAADAVRHLGRVVELDARDRQAATSLAWLLATTPDDAVRDGKRAVALARAAGGGGAGQTPELLDVLAAALAETGAFDEAVATAAQALSLLGKDKSAFAERVQARLALYNAHKPYRAP